MSTYPSRMAEVFNRHMGVWRVFSSDEQQHDFCDDLADAWCEACTITTVEQLDALPVGAVIRSRRGDALTRFDIGWHGTYINRLGRVTQQSMSAGIAPLPALLIWSPDWELP